MSSSTSTATGGPGRAKPLLYPLELLRAVLLVFCLQLKRALHLRSTLFAGLVAFLPVALAGMIFWISQERELYTGPILLFSWLLQVRAVVPIVALLVGAGVVADEVDDRTIAYLLVRPFPRPALLLGRWIAVAVILSVLLSLSTSISLWVLGKAVVEASQDNYPPGFNLRILVTVVSGGLVYSALFAAAGTILRHPILVGAGYVFAVEGLLGSLPGEGQSMTVQFYLKSYLVAGDQRLRRVVELVPEAMGTVELVSPSDALITLAWIGGVALTVGSLVLARRQFVLSS
ncbi:MAG: hypothetical protein ACI8QS_000159 [Planctomycetota bacterium]|jgi:hypothetical protein